MRRAFFGAFWLLSACAAKPTAPEGGEFLRQSNELAACRARGLEAADGGQDAGWSAYEACKREAGL